MTKSTKGSRQPALEGMADDKPRCRWCRRAIPTADGPGRPREFCSQACRQWDWVARQRARELKLSEDQLVMTRTELDDLHDALYVLACAVQDVRRDLEDNKKPTARELGEMLRWILDCADPLETIRLRP
ncbi:MAG: hypothetical protein ACKOYL_09085 [Actinomycetota bacterium]